MIHRCNSGRLKLKHCNQCYRKSTKSILNDKEDSDGDETDMAYGGSGVNNDSKRGFPLEEDCSKTHPENLEK